MARYGDDADPVLKERTPSHLDEPMSSLDPLARHGFLSALMDTSVAEGTTILLSSHILADLERICDFLILLSGSRVQVADDIDRVMATHALLVGTRRTVERIPGADAILHVRHTERQTTVLARTSGQVTDPSWDVKQPTLEEIVFAYLRDPGAAAPQRLVPVGQEADSSRKETWQ